MKTFKVYWQEFVLLEGKDVLHSFVIAVDFAEALAIASTYGKVKSIFTESDSPVITEPQVAVAE